MRPRLIVLTAHPELRTPRRLVDAGRALGIEVELRVPGAAAPDATDPAGALVLARPGTFSLAAVLRALRELTTRGARAVQPRGALLDACDQARTLRRAQEAELPIPRSYLIRRPGEVAAALAAIPGPPWFVKGRRGSQGTQVLLASDADAATRAAHRFWGVGASCLLQEDLRSRGPVERHFVVAQRVVASALAHPAPGEFRSNVHRGGRVVAIEPGSTRAAALALRAVRAIGLPFAAVDAFGGDEPLILEVNASPGVESLERATGRDLVLPLLATLMARSDDGATAPTPSPAPSPLRSSR